MKELDNNRIEELLPRYCEGRLSEGERLEVEAWIDESGRINELLLRLLPFIWLWTRFR